MRGARRSILDAGRSEINLGTDSHYFYLWLIIRTEPESAGLRENFFCAFRAEVTGRRRRKTWRREATRSVDVGGGCGYTFARRAHSRGYKFDYDFRTTGSSFYKLRVASETTGTNAMILAIKRPGPWTSRNLWPLDPPRASHVLSSDIGHVRSESLTFAIAS